ncbi:MAG: ATP-grasp domain-containing protein [Candidatus Zixiibacteriota bacterium]
MPGKKIGLIGQYIDADVQLLKAKIEDRGGEAKIIDLSLFPDTVRGSITLEKVIFDDQDLLELNAFYIRKLAAIWNLPVPDFNKEDWAVYYERFNDYMDNFRAIHSFKISLARILCERKLVVNPYDAWDLHHLKIYQYFLLREKGFKVPDFVASNNFYVLREFLEKYPAVEKPIVTGPVRRVYLEALETEKDLLRDRPIVYQEYIEGASIRAFVLGEQVIAACVLPAKAWGVDASENIASMQPVVLPEDINKEIVRAAKSLGMLFSGVDLQYRESTGEFYFLECNVAPYFRPYDTQINADIGGKLADFLLERA